MMKTPDPHIADALQIQDAVDATSSGSIFIYKGTYTEQVSQST
jgi:hypothetical protein